MWIKYARYREDPFSDTRSRYFTGNQRAPAASAVGHFLYQPGGNQVNPRLTLVHAGWTCPEGKKGGEGAKEGVRRIPVRHATRTAESSDKKVARLCFSFNISSFLSLCLAPFTHTCAQARVCGRLLNITFFAGHREGGSLPRARAHAVSGGRLFLGPSWPSSGPWHDRLSIIRYELSTSASIRADIGSSDAITLSKLYLARRGRKLVMRSCSPRKKYCRMEPSARDV